MSLCKEGLIVSVSCCAVVRRGGRTHLLGEVEVRFCGDKDGGDIVELVLLLKEGEDEMSV